MKKILFGLFALSTISFGAYTTHDDSYYLKFSGDLGGKYSSYTSHGDTALKEGKTGLGWEIAVEELKKLHRTDSYEDGFGVAYQDHGKAKSSTLSTGETVTSRGFRSGVVYYAGKYNFNAINEFTPYLKGNLGYSFNSQKGKVKVDSKSVHTKMSNGVYAAFGAGFEYNEFFTMELLYQFNQGKLKATLPTGSHSSTYNSSRVTLGFGIAIR